MTDVNSIPVRVCTSCKIEKPATREHFHAYKRAPDGCRAVCKVCRAADHAENRVERTAQRREHYRENRERLNAAARAYYAENAEAQRGAAKLRHQRNRDRNNAVTRAYHAANRDRLNAQKREASKKIFRERYGTDPFFTLRHRTRSLVRRTLSAGKGGARLEEVLGYSIDELRLHLERQFEKGMSWELFFSGKIHIDHIVPVAHFKPESYDSPEFKSCWALSNLRPMWAKDNIAKGARVTTLL